MVLGKFVTKIAQSIPSWELTKYYGRVALFQLQCLKYRIETSETWFKLVNRFMPGKLKSEAELGDQIVEDKIENTKIGGKIHETMAQVSSYTSVKEKFHKLWKKIHRGSSSDEGGKCKRNNKAEEIEGKEYCIKGSKSKKLK